MNDEANTVLRKSMDNAANEYGGLCAAAALSALSKAFAIYIEEEALISGTGIYMHGENALAQNAYIGACQFLAVAARQRGASREEAAQLFDEWKQCFAQHFERLPCTQNVENGFFEALLLAYNFTDLRRSALGLNRAVAKPKKYYDNIFENREIMFTHSSYALEARLIKAVMRGEHERALKILREITAKGEKAVLAKEPLRSAKNSMIASIAFLSRAAIQAGVNADSAFSLSDALTQQVEELSDKRTVLAFEENILLQFIELVRQRLENTYSTPVTRAIHYIENRLENKITLPAAADYAKVHAAYLSGRFKQETGLTFSFYIIMRKIQESSYFVRHSAYSVSQIASLYGFSSQSYYITTFKRVMRLTPMEYRRRFWTE